MVGVKKKETTPMTPADLIRWQERMGLTVTEGAAVLGVTRRAYQKWRKGENRIPAPIVKLTALLELNKGAKK
jgi:transcriptional regulator with XRE-family HTH domain